MKVKERIPVSTRRYIFIVVDKRMVQLLRKWF